MDLLLGGVLLTALSGVPGLLSPRRAAWGQWLVTLLAVAGGALGITATLQAVAAGEVLVVHHPWSLPGGELHLELDALSAVFLLPVFLVSLLGSVYGLGYWKQEDHPENGRQLRLFYGVLTAAMAVVVLARNAILFLVAWEVMALAAFFLVATEDEEPAVREASWLYLAATHLASLSLIALFGLLRLGSGSFTLVPLAPDTISSELATALFLLALIGFGLKAGIMPLHVWLPGAHASAPSHVSALMSGVILKMGVYGLLRVVSLLPEAPAWWGGLLLSLGAISGVLGMAFALGQHDLKRLLAYSSIENIGIIVMGIGLALVGRSLHRADWVILGLSGALLHVWNHALFKSLLFFGAGSVIHAAHTRTMDQLGGLAKRMPVTSLCFLVGAVAICGLPPLNGFVGEWLIYLGLFRTLGIGPGPSWAGGAFAAPALALIGALALACFTRVYGTVFLGAGRSERTRSAHEAPYTMLLPMLVLAACCLFIGLCPGAVTPVLEQAVNAWLPGTAVSRGSLTALAPLGWISVMSVILLTLVLFAGQLLAWRLRREASDVGVTWDCGYAAPSPRMQYTASSFAQMLTGWLAWALRPRRHEPAIDELFPGPCRFQSEVPDAVLEGAVQPTVRFYTWLSSGLRVLQQGSVQVYLVYIVVALICLLLWR